MIDELRKRISPDIREQVPLAPMTSFKVGGPAEYFLEAKDAETVSKAIKACSEMGIPYFMFGGGTNILVNDDGIKGLTIRLANDRLVIDGPSLLVGAGVLSSRAARETSEAGLAGLEWMIGLPGTVGGAVRGNAGMYGGEVKDNLESVIAVNSDGIMERMAAADCQFGYRDSVFKHLPGTVIVSARFMLKPSTKEETMAKMKGFLAKKTAEQPVAGHTAGCMFKNWKPSNDDEIEKIRRSLDLNKEEEIPYTATGAIPAGWIIDRAQLKGMKVGHSQVSEKHGNFIVHDGEGTASEILALASAVKMKVRDMTHGIIMFEDEVEYAGF